MTRYLFTAPASRSASGGTAVLYDSVVTLREAGFDAAILLGDPRGRYLDVRTPPPAFWSRRLRNGRLRRAYWLDAARGVARLAKGGPGTAPPVEHLDVREDDVIVIPEFDLDAATAAFPNNRHVVFVQNPLMYLHVIGHLRRDQDPGNVIATLAGAESCVDACTLVGDEPVFYVPVGPRFDLYDYRAEKRLQVCWMPRKRRVQARFLERALRASPALEGVMLVPIDGMPLARVAEVMRDSLIFVSLMKEESLGFPGIEAMASGCYVIGYTGLGAREYFDEASGRTVEEGDLLGIVRATEAAICAWRQDPAPIDAVRRSASERVRERYGPERCRAALLEAFGRIDALL